VDVFGMEHPCEELVEERELVFVSAVCLERAQRHQTSFDMLL